MASRTPVAEGENLHMRVGERKGAGDGSPTKGEDEDMDDGSDGLGGGEAESVFDEEGDEIMGEDQGEGCSEVSIQKLKFDSAIALQGGSLPASRCLSNAKMQLHPDMVRGEERKRLMKMGLPHMTALCAFEVAFTVVHFYQGGAVLCDIPSKAPATEANTAVLTALQSTSPKDLEEKYVIAATAVDEVGQYSETFQDTRIWPDATEMWRHAAEPCEGFCMDIATWRWCDGCNLPRAPTIERVSILSVERIMHALIADGRDTRLIGSAHELLECHFKRYTLQDRCPACMGQYHWQQFLIGDPPRYVALEWIATFDRQCDVRTFPLHHKFTYTNEQMEERVATVGHVAAVEYQSEARDHMRAVILPRGQTDNGFVRDSYTNDVSLPVPPERFAEGDSSTPAVVVLRWNADGMAGLTMAEE